MDKITSKVPKKKLKKRTKFTILAVFNIIWYAIVDMILTYNNSPLPADLTIAWFAAWTVELALLKGIKVKSKDSPEEYSEDYNVIEQEDAAIDTYNAEIDAQMQDEANTPDYDDAVG